MTWCSCWSICHDHESCKNYWINPDAFGEAHIRWRFTLTPPGKYDKSVFAAAVTQPYTTSYCSNLFTQTCGKACCASWAHIICCSSRSTCCNRCSSRVAPIGAWRSVGHDVWNRRPSEWPASVQRGRGIRSQDCMWSMSFLYNMPDSWHSMQQAISIMTTH